MAVIFMLLLLFDGANPQMRNLIEDPHLTSHLYLTVEAVKDTSIVNIVSSFQLKGINDSLDTIHFNLKNADISSVRINERPADYVAEGDTISISISDIVASGNLLSIDFVYSVNRHEFFLTGPANQFRLPLLPYNDRIPIPLNNAIVLSGTDIRIIVPEQWNAMTNGSLVSTTLLPGGRRLFHWNHSLKIDHRRVSLSFGEYQLQQSRLNDIDVVVAYANTLPSLKNINDTLSDLLNQFSSHGFPYPFESLTLIFEEDHRWETRQSHPTIGFVFQNAGRSEHQVKRILAEQLFGSSIKPSDNTSDYIIALLQASLINRIWPDYQPDPWELNPEVPDSPYHVHSVHYLNNALFTIRNDIHLQTLLETVSDSLIHTRVNYLDWDLLMSFLDPEDRIDPPQIIDSKFVNIDRFTINYSEGQQQGQYVLEFIPENLYSGRTITLTVRQFSNGTYIDVPLFVSSHGDRIAFNVNGKLDNIYVVDSSESIVFNENKPSSFWRYQLRNDPDYNRRIEAAKGFGRITDNPDIQLFIQDLIRNEPDSKVKSHLIESYARITSGASGTHSRFIPFLTDQDNIIRDVALASLKNYKGNPQVIQEVFRIISSSNDIEFVNKAITVYYHIVDEEEFFSVGRSLLVEDLEDIFFTSTIIPLLVKTERGLSFAPTLMQYLEPEYPVMLRILTLMTLKELEISASYWQEVLPSLISATDARIRYHSLEILPKIDRQIAIEIISEQSSSENDARVRKRMADMLQRL